MHYFCAFSGKAEVDYPIYHSIPKSSFSCIGRPPGFYADPEHRCQVWHVCDMRSRQVSFLCTNGTVYSQEKRVCDWWYKVDCDAESVNRNYALNSELWVENNNDEEQVAAETSYASFTTKSPNNRRQHSTFVTTPTPQPTFTTNKDARTSNRIVDDFTTIQSTTTTSTTTEAPRRRSSSSSKKIIDLKSPESPRRQSRPTTTTTKLPVVSTTTKAPVDSFAGIPGLPPGHKIVVRVNPNSALGKLSDEEIKARVLKTIKEQIARGIVPTSARTEHIPVSSIPTTPKPTKNPKVLLVVPQGENGKAGEPFYIVEKKNKKQQQKQQSYKPHDPSTEKRFRHSTPRKHNNNVKFATTAAPDPTKSNDEERQVLSESQRRPAFPYSFNGFHRLEAVTGKTIYPDKVVELDEEINTPPTTTTTKAPRRSSGHRNRGSSTRRVKATTSTPDVRTLNLSTEIRIKGPSEIPGRRIKSGVAGATPLLVKKGSTGRKKKIIKIRRPLNQRTTVTTELPEVSTAESVKTTKFEVKSTGSPAKSTTYFAKTTKSAVKSTVAPTYENEDDLLAAELDRLAAIYGQRITYI